MNEFIEVPANKNSLAQRKLTCGVGVNDAQYITSKIVDGKKVTCPYYKKWNSMIKRCYSIKYQKDHPTYKGCTVCGEWLVFSRFKSWMANKDWNGKSLDKDILVQGNKVYSPNTCLFVTQSINNLVNDYKAKRGVHPLGVGFNKSRGKYQAAIHINGINYHLGVFVTAEKAHDAYKVAKYKAINDAADGQPEPIKSALLRLVIL